MNNGWNVELSNVRVLLTDTNKDDRFPSRVHHVDGSTNLVVNSVKLGQNDPINRPWVVFDSEVDQGLVELCQLVNGVVSDESFSNEEHHVWLVDVHKLCQLSHEPFIALHSASRVNQHNVILLVPGLLQSLFGNHSWIVLVPLLIKRDVEARSVDFELFNCATSEVVAACQHHLEVPLSLQVVRNLCQGS